MRWALALLLPCAAVADVRSKEKKTKKYAEDTGFDWSQTSDGCGTPRRRARRAPMRVPP